MFQKLGNLVSSAWWAFLLAWGLLLALLTWTAPRWRDIILEGEFAFLPETTSSRHGEKVFKEAFPRQYFPSNAVIVLSRAESQLTSQDINFIKQDLYPGLEHIAKQHRDSKSAKEKSIIGAMHSFQEPGAGSLLVSPDRKATLVILELTSELLEIRNWPVLAQIEDLVSRLKQEGKVPDGLNISQGGTAMVGRDVTQGQARSTQAIHLWTIVLVVVLLLLIYRAPLLTLVPLITVFVAVQVALKFLSLLAQAEVLTVFEAEETFITVIVYGTGVDYCLFLISRYREELQEGRLPSEAIANAIGKVGATLLASSATVTLGIAMMIFADFGQFHLAGIAISSSLFLSLFAVLSLTPALLRLCGRWAFWPKFPSKNDSGQWEKVIAWNRLATILQRRPGTILLSTVALMLPFAVLALLQSDNLEFDLVNRLPSSAPSIAGNKDLARHFPEGLLDPVIVLLRNPDVDFQEDRGEALLESLTRRLALKKEEMGLADIRTLARPLGITQAAQEALDELLTQQQLSPKKQPGGSMYQEALDHYVSMVHVTQLQLVLHKNPLARPSLDLLKHIENVTRQEMPQELQDGEVIFFGLTPSILDLRETTDHDRVRIEFLVVACVFLILVILLRRPVVSLYLIASVLLSFFTALGATFALFWLLDPSGFSGLDWKVPIFLFVILVAIGEDYNIFLMTRVREEQKHRDGVAGIKSALVKTGPIITSCGLIMIGTFSSLLAGSLVDLKQLGFALAFGVLLDTFVVRPLLVPAFLIWLANRHFRSPWRFLLIKVKEKIEAEIRA
jgi:putative drug exporter of the RND superfamily